MSKGKLFIYAKADAISSSPLAAACPVRAIDTKNNMAAKNLAAILVWLDVGQCERD